MAYRLVLSESLGTIRPIHDPVVVRIRSARNDKEARRRAKKIWSAERDCGYSYFFYATLFEGDRIVKRYSLFSKTA